MPHRFNLLAGHPKLETVHYPAPENGVDRRNPRAAGAATTSGSALLAH